MHTHTHTLGVCPSLGSDGTICLHNSVAPAGEDRQRSHAEGSASHPHAAQRREGCGGPPGVLAIGESSQAHFSSASLCKDHHLYHHGTTKWQHLLWHYLWCHEMLLGRRHLPHQTPLTTSGMKCAVLQLPFGSAPSEREVPTPTLPIPHPSCHSAVEGLQREVVSCQI